MDPANQLLERIEAGRLWAYFHKDWLLQIRGLIRPQLPAEFSVFVDLSEAFRQACEFNPWERLVAGG